MAGKAPEWIKLLPLGEVKLTDGRPPFEVTAGDLEKIVADFQGRGLDMVMDYEHQSLSGGPAPAAAWIKELQARDDGLYARVDWTPQAQEYLANQEYRYFSPVLMMDENGHPQQMLHLGLTNVPAIAALPPLVGRAVAAGLAALGDQRAKDAQQARAQKWNISIKDGGNVSKPIEWAGVPDEEFADPVNYRYPMQDEAHARNAWSRWGDAANQAQYNEAERALIENRIMARCRALGIKITPKEAAKAMLEKIKEILTLKAEATEAEALARITGLMALPGVFTELKTVLGLEEEAGPSEVKGAVLALKQGGDRLVQVEKELKILQGQHAQREAETAVAAAIQAGKVLPAQREWALKYAREDPNGFETYAAQAPKLVPTGESLRIVKDGNEQGLTPGELAICKQLNLKPEAFLATKQTQAAG
jgi:phage I-like protein